MFCDVDSRKRIVLIHPIYNCDPCVQKELLNVFPNEVCLAWLICLILIKSLIFTQNTRNRGQNVPDVKIKFIKIKFKI